MMLAARKTQIGDKDSAEEKGPRGIQSAPLEPIRHVERELTRPDGTTVTVKVPVYPPFRLADRGTAATESRPRKASLPKRKAS